MKHLHTIAVLAVTLLGMSVSAKPAEVAQNETFIPEHNQVFALFMEQPWLNFIRSMTKPEIRALEAFKVKEHREHYTDDQFSKGLGKQSKSAQEKFDKMMAETKKLQSGLKEKAKKVIEEIDSAFKDMDEDFTRDDLKKWIVGVAKKLNTLDEDEKDSVMNTQPNKSILMSRTALMKIRTEEEAEKFIQDMIRAFGRW